MKADMNYRIETKPKMILLGYYDCVRQKKHLCDKKMLPKEKLENFIVYKTMKVLQNDSVIEELSAIGNLINFLFLSL